MGTAPSLHPTIVTHLLCTPEASGPGQQGLFLGPEPMPIITLLGVTSPQYWKLWPSHQGPRGENGQWGRGQNPESWSLCLWPVSCGVLASTGTSLFPTQSWQDSQFILLQPQSAESMFPLELQANGQAAGDTPQGREGREGQGGHPGWRTAVATLLHWLAVSVGLPVAQTAPTHPWGLSWLLRKLELTAQAPTGSEPRPEAREEGESRSPWSLSRAPGWGSQSRLSRKDTDTVVRSRGVQNTKRGRSIYRTPGGVGQE